MAVLADWGINVVLGEIWITRYPTVAGRGSKRPADEFEPSTPDPDHRRPATLGVG